MADLKTKYLGLELRNPIILGASNLVNNLDNVKRAEDNGVAAIVYKSLFEEQIQLERAQLDDQLDEYADRGAEMTSIFPNIEHAGPEEHLFNVARVKQSVGIPVIASLNAILSESWVDYAKQIEKTGVDAIEINFFYVPKTAELDGHEVVKQQVEVLKKIKAAVKIPVSVKMSLFYTNPLNFIKKVDEAGADGYVLFNRFFQPEIDIEKEEYFYPWELSNPKDHMVGLRYAGLLYGNVEGSVCISRGIYDANDVIKMLLAGADVIQMVSAIYRN